MSSGPDMPEDGTMSDPVGQVVAYDALFGGLVDTAELVLKSMPGASDVSIPQALGTRRTLTPQQRRQRREKREAQVGLASNVLGLAAGAGALGAAVGRQRSVSADVKAGRKPTPGPVAAAAERATSRLKNPRLVRLARTASSPKAVAVGAGTALALQGANVAGDVVANRVLSREAKKDVSKGMFFRSAATRQGYRAARAGRKAMRNPAFASAARANTQRVSRVWRPRVLVGSTGLGAGGGAVGGYMYGTAPVGQVVPTKEQARQPLEQRGVLPKDDKKPVAKADVQEVTWSGTFSKRDDEKRNVFGWANVSEVDGKPVLDRQGDYVPLAEMEDAAYRYVIKSRAGGNMHRRAPHDGEQPLKVSEMIESFVVTPEKLKSIGIPDDIAKSVPHGWWVGYHVEDDDTWNQVKSGERTGFSIHGRGKRIPMTEPVAKADAPISDTQLRNKKRIQSHLSMTGAVLGLGALGLKGAGGTARRVLPSAGVITRRQGVRVARRLDRASNTALTFGAGVGGAGGINFAQIQSAEARKRPVVKAYAAPIPPYRAEFDPERARLQRSRRYTDASAAAAGGTAVAALGASGAPQALARRPKEIRRNYRRNATIAEKKRLAAGGTPTASGRPSAASRVSAAGTAARQEVTRPRKVLFGDPKAPKVMRDGQRVSSRPGAVRQARWAMQGKKPGAALRALAATPAGGRGIRTVALGASAAGLAAAAVKGNRDLRLQEGDNPPGRARPYRPDEWYR